MPGGKAAGNKVKIWIVSAFPMAVFVCTLLVIRPSMEGSPGGIYPDEVFCVVSVNGGGYTKQNRVFIKQGDDISVLPVFIINGGFYSEVGHFVIDNKMITAKRLPGTEFFWYQINPEYREGGYDNFALAPKKQFNTYLEPISYSYLQIGESGELRLADIVCDGYGAYYIQAMPKNSIPDDFESSGAIYIESGVTQIVYRSGDSYLGYLSEHMRSPFIMYPKNTMPGHQTDLIIGSDCAEFAIYGFRRLGYDIPYCGPQNIHKYLTPLTEDEFIMPGDILHFGVQVAVYFESRAIPGKIDDKDILLQSYGVKPHFTTVGENVGLFGAYSVYRHTDLR